MVRVFMSTVRAGRAITPEKVRSGCAGTLKFHLYASRFRRYQPPALQQGIVGVRSDQVAIGVQANQVHERSRMDIAGPDALFERCNKSSLQFQRQKMSLCVEIVLSDNLMSGAPGPGNEERSGSLNPDS